VSIFAVGWIDRKLFPTLPVSLYGLVIAMWMLIVGWERRRWYYRVFAVVLLLIAFLPSSYSTIGSEAFTKVFGGTFNLIFGVGWAVMGLLDHRLLTHLLQPVQEVAGGQPQ
jgi:hypothetical protein